MKKHGGRRTHVYLRCAKETSAVKKDTDTLPEWTKQAEGRWQGRCMLRCDITGGDVYRGDKRLKLSEKSVRSFLMSYAKSIGILYSRGFSYAIDEINIFKCHLLRR